MRKTVFPYVLLLAVMVTAILLPVEGGVSGNAKTGTETSETRISGTETADDEESERIKIGFSVIDKNSNFATDIVGIMREQLSDLSVQVIYHEPESYLSSWQLEDVRALAEEGISHLVILPGARNQSFHALMEELSAAGIKIILISTEEGNYDYAAAQIRIDPREEGRMIADKLAEVFAGKQCRVVEIREDSGSIVSTLRAKGFEERADEYDNITIVEKGSGGGNAGSAQSVMEGIVQWRGIVSFNAVFSCTDADGIGVMRALEEANLQPGTYFTLVSIGGDEDVKKAIKAKKYTATVQYTEELGEAVSRVLRGVIENSVSGGSVVNMESAVVDWDNVTDFFAGVGR